MHAPGRISFGGVPRQEPTLFGPEDLAYERGLLEKAQAQTEDNPLEQESLAKVMHHLRAHELFAQATAIPAQLDREYSRDEINKPLLGFYVNDDGKKLAQAIDHYDNKLTDWGYTDYWMNVDASRMEVAKFGFLAETVLLGDGGSLIGNVGQGYSPHNMSGCY